MVDVDSSSHCSICLTDISNHASTTLQCEHTFHTHCYTTFLAHNIINKKEDIQCPLCRETILQIVVHSPTNIHLITNVHDDDNQEEGEDNEGNEGNQVTHHSHPLLLDNYQQQRHTIDDNDASVACTMVTVSVLKVLSISFIMYIIFLFVQCGMGNDNMLCNSNI
jgi:DNA-directed RNA polymerase subunit RPC12/RpoP